MKVCIVIVAVLVIAAIIAWVLIRSRQVVPSRSDVSFSMSIDDVFALKGKSKIVVVGIIATGEIFPGDTLLVKVENGSIPVIVEGLEAFHKPLKSAKAGDRVGVMLQGIEKEQVTFPATLVDGDNMS